MSNNRVFFKPWVGRDYLSGGMFGKRIMVLGDSHYCGEDCKECGKDFCCACNDFTNKVVRDYLDESNEWDGWKSTYLKFERSLVGRETSHEDSVRIWKSILFYNYLQVAMQGPRRAGTPEQYRDAASPFFSVLDRYQPDVLVVWGVRLWNSLPSDRWEDGPEMMVDGYSIQNGYYRTGSGKRVHAICVYHPSVGYSWDYWYRAIMSVR